MATRVVVAAARARARPRATVSIRVEGMKTNLQSIFNSLKIELGVANYNIRIAKERFELDSETVIKLSDVSSLINEALSSLKECEQDVPLEQLHKFE
jgi:hypothetical protein